MAFLKYKIYYSRRLVITQDIVFGDVLEVGLRLPVSRVAVTIHIIMEPFSVSSTFASTYFSILVVRGCPPVTNDFPCIHEGSTDQPTDEFRKVGAPAIS